MGSIGYIVYGSSNPESLTEFTKDEASQVINLLLEFESLFSDDIESLEKHQKYFPFSVLLRISIYFEEETNFSKYDMIYIVESRMRTDEDSNSIDITFSSSDDRTYAIIKIYSSDYFAYDLDTIKKHLTISKEHFAKNEINQINGNPIPKMKGECDMVKKINKNMLRSTTRKLERSLQILKDLNI